MLPVREVRPRPLSAPPYVVLSFIIANALVFLHELAVIAQEGSGAVFAWAFVPHTLQIDPAAGVLTMLTSMFLHGGWMHLLGNLLFLWIFGPSVEAALGSKRFAGLYLLSGVGAAIAQAALDPLAKVPMLGASGAISGVLAAYVSLFPRRRIDTLAFVFVLPLPALFFVLEWFAMNLLRGMGALSAATSGGVAWWAHIGGFLAGLVLVRLLFPRATTKALPQRWEVEVRGPRGERYSVQTRPPPGALHPGHEA